MSGMSFNKQVVIGLQEQLRREVGASSDARRRAADSGVSQRQQLALAAQCDERAAQFRALLRLADSRNAAKYADPVGQPDAQEWARRAAVLAGVRELIDFLEAHPELPVDSLSNFAIFLNHSSDPDVEERGVDQFAAVLGVPSGREAPNRHYRAGRAFGPGGAVTVESYACKRTDINWKYGDPFPDWWPTPEAVDAAAKFAADLVDESAAPAGDQVLDERMLGMGEPAAEESADGNLVHAAKRIESGVLAGAMCGAKGLALTLADDVPLVTCATCAAMLLGDQVGETQDLVDAYLEVQSELDQALVREELQRQAQAAAGQEEPAGDGAPHLCGSRAVTPSGDVGVCRLDDGHDEPDSEYYDARVRVGHFDPAFGFWNGATVRRTEHTPYYGNPQLCARCGRSLPLDGYCLDGSIELAASAENLDQAVSPR